MKIRHWKEWEENLVGDGQALFSDFIESMMRWLPEDCPTAKEALEYKLLTDSNPRLEVDSVVEDHGKQGYAT